MQEIEDFTRNWIVLGNHLALWITALFIFVACLILLPRVRGQLVQLLSRFAVSRFDVIMTGAQSLANNTYRFFFAALALYFASLVLVLPVQISRMITGIVLVATMAQIGMWSSIMVGLWIDHGLLDKNNPDPERTSAAQIIRFTGLALIWTAVLLLVLSNFGIDITALVAGLGVGGIAIAFALQSILKDLFASLSILLDKPFVVGDFVFFNENRGVVERIGLRTTRFRSLTGEQISVSNDALLNTRLSNFQRMSERRMLFSLHVQYGGSIDLLQTFPAYLQTTIETLPNTRFDRSHLAEFNELGVRFEVVYYVLSAEYADFMNAQQAVLVAAAKWVEAHGLQFAQPTRRLITVNDEALSATQKTSQAVL
ncbi:mechanosensitive ion channel family protein [Paenochrobactrum sp. BZR 201-1]|uniref:mechanosensitive ion channel family protein n=1 Tax=Paenochrobactrum sp. BZR 201-1 TaxID=3378075 RepID=UPI0038552F1E